uniref:Uncharacterized protein n=1 Tax=viral metagenome TaxID=1070528 RepID=A0A6C0IZ82_9ZZZZ
MGSLFSREPYNPGQELLDACSREHLENYWALPAVDYGEDEMLVLRSCAIALGRRKIPLSEVFDHQSPYAEDYWRAEQLQ